MRQLTRLLAYLRPYVPHFIGSILLMAVVGLMDAFRILLMGPIIDRVLNPKTAGRSLTLFNFPGTHHVVYLQDFVPQHFRNPLTVVAVALVGTALIKGVCDYIGTYLVNHAGFGLITDLRNRLYDTLLQRSISFFSRHSTGTLVSTVVNDVEKVQVTLTIALAEFLQQFFTLVFLIGVVIVLGHRLALVLLIFVPFVVVSAGKIGRRVRSTTRKGQDKLADIQNILHESIAGNRIVKAFGMENWESTRFRAAARKLFRANLKSVAVQAVSSPLMDIIGALAGALLLWVGRNQINSGEMTPGAFIAFIIAVFRLYDPVRKMAFFNNSFQQALGASQEIFRFIDEEDDVREKPDAIVLPAFRDRVRFENVSFSYAGTNGPEAEILHNVNLETRAGEVVAIVGSSGAGKTTLVNLIPRFFDVSSGAVKLDGHDIRDLTLASLRAQIGVVTQETILFNDTVRNNVAYGQPHVTEEAVIDAAKAALAHDFILRLPEGYDTMIGERGLRLSGGERQRIAIARALLKNAPILILDEATSSLDTESEALVQGALQNLISGRTVFVIAHRLTTVRHADRIVVLEGGHIADSGTHEDLLTRLGTYRKLYELQFMELDPKMVDEPGIVVREPQIKN
ncbi:MAG TPA: ABC transporter ATP-binding protein [Candidatus Polarisedimenticolia bacterium]|jgi:subfamily B ATP-binding cassette protein MsbA|nr:ABC transporter ATP-binding protein [Candidatus Polarisedimenticolia bacterium]